jgi:APA family basic amino acid/polyamine antiporter
MTSPEAVHDAQPRPTLSLFDAVAMIVGLVVGAVIFKAPSIVAGSVDSAQEFALLWIAGGVISLVGALCYAELGSSFPNAGGEYFFLRTAYGNSLAFLFAWARMTVIQTGAIVAIGFVLGDYATLLYPLGPKSSAIYAALAVTSITLFNMRGTQGSKILQNVLTVGLMLAYAAIIVTAMLYTPPAQQAAAGAPASSHSAVGFAMIFILLTYGGWNEAAYLSAEIRDGRRNIVRSLVIGITIVTVLYLLLNLAYYHVLGLSGMSESTAVAADMMKAALGASGATILAVVIIAEALTTLNGTVFTGARTNYAFGRDFYAFRFLGQWDDRAMAPRNAILVQGVIALALVLFGAFTRDGFSTMVDFTAPVFWLFFLLTGASLFVLRRREPAQSQPFRVPLYPFTPIVFCATCVYMLYSSLAYVRFGALVGLGVLCVGIPVMLIARATQRQR